MQLEQRRTGRCCAGGGRRSRRSAPRRRPLWVRVAGMLLGLVALGCVKKAYPPNREVVSEVELVGADEVDNAELLSGLATVESSRFLGIWDGVAFEYEIFDEHVLARDLARVERYYRARGYYEAKVTAGRVIHIDENHVRVEIHVHEGEPVLVEMVNILGVERLPLSIGATALSSRTLEADERFDEKEFEESAKVMENFLADNGYAFVKVERHAKVDVSRHRAVVTYDVKPGPPAVYGDIQIVGLKEIPERPVRANLYIEEGDDYSRSDVRDAQDALINLGVFASVEVRQDKSRPESGKVPIKVVVQESSLRAVRAGVGGRFDVLRLSGHVRLGWEDKNFLGGMRDFSIDTRPGVTFYPTRLDRDNIRAPTNYFPENRLSAELRQPSFLEGRTQGFLRGEYNIYPLLYPLPTDADPEEERIIGYHEVKAASGLERAFFNHHLYVTPSYNWQANFPFTYQGGDIPPGLDTVKVSFPELFAIFDYRDDRIEPHKGLYLSNSFQVAGYVFGGDVSDVRVRPEARFYLPLSSRVTLALRSGAGLLFPSNYGETLDTGTAEGQAAELDPTDPDVIRDQHKLLFRAFYSGGPSSNRGYPFRGVGPHGPIGFLVPTGRNCSLAGREVSDLDPACIRPLGGLTLWEATVEVRYPIIGPLKGATFADASDVTRTVGEFRFTVPHLSAGQGLRYVTPVGPLRADVGYRLPGLQGEPGVDRGEYSGIFGLPIAIHIALGEAF